MDKTEAARRAEGFIELDKESAEQVKQAILQVANIIAEEGNQVKFEGHRIVEGHGFGRVVNCYDVFECPRGFLLHTYINKAPNWAVAGKTVEAMLEAVPDRTVARRAHGELVKKRFLSFHHH